LCTYTSRDKADYCIYKDSAQTVSDLRMFVLSSNIIHAQTVPEMVIIVFSKIVRAQTVPEIRLFVMSRNIVHA
jgi:hypothetical protein